MTAPIPADVTGALFMAMMLLALGIFAVLRPEKLLLVIESLAISIRAEAERLGFTAEPAIRHPSGVFLRRVQVTFAVIGIGGALLCAYVANLGMTR